MKNITDQRLCCMFQEFWTNHRQMAVLSIFSEHKKAFLLANIFQSHKFQIFVLTNMQKFSKTLLLCITFALLEKQVVQNKFFFEIIFFANFFIMYFQSSYVLQYVLLLLLFWKLFTPNWRPFLIFCEIGRKCSFLG